MVAPSPLINDYLAELAGIDEEMAAKFRATSVGCSDDYSGHYWGTESLVMLVVLATIGVLILLGTVLDFYQANYHKPWFYCKCEIIFEIIRHNPIPSE